MGVLGISLNVKGRYINTSFNIEVTVFLSLESVDIINPSRHPRYGIRTSASQPPALPSSTEDPHSAHQQQQRKGLPFKKRRLDITPPSSPEAAVHSQLQEHTSSPWPDQDSRRSPVIPLVSPSISPPLVSPTSPGFSLLPLLLQSRLIAQVQATAALNQQQAQQDALDEQVQRQLLDQQQALDIKSQLHQALSQEPQSPDLRKGLAQRVALLSHLRSKTIGAMSTTPTRSSFDNHRETKSAPTTPLSCSATNMTPLVSASRPCNTPQKGLVPCPDCGKGFAASNLTNHIRRNHKQLQVRHCHDKFV